ncbi:DUF4177 domain-containing protein [Loktanella sp. IMCC34160]|uniref:DUF4177 domain-containing protein n=1 Tax=Loktanella sp. IMCC34160 TaxID=2510646 RepID=UPI00101D8B1C|nr:DUF4177 domain-containing protein [Loktanella sp. IMCC34160]RYG91754.1 DUF4177 domain-containing protein [Loktanella sp. IMCC34160]
MGMFEYKIVPAPKRGTKARGVKTAEDRFALSMEQVINGLAAEGWEYIRADTLPSEERSGLTGRTTVYQNLLVFRRALPPTDEEILDQILAESHDETADLADDPEADEDEALPPADAEPAEPEVGEDAGEETPLPEQEKA